MRAVAALVRVVLRGRTFRAGAGMRLSRVRFCWQAKHLVTPGVGVEVPLWHRFAPLRVFPRGVLR